MNIPAEIIKIYKKFEEAGFEIYLVGGCVRNLLLKKHVKDWDMATNATPEDMLKLFPNAFYDNQFGTVGIPLKDFRIADTPEHPGVVETTTYRTEHGYIDRRHPQKVSWGKTIEEDLSRRDFTINAIALKIENGTTSDKIIDPFDGSSDLKKKIIKAVGDPKKRFKEDALRLMRAIRFAAQLSFTIDEQTWIEITKDASLIKEISSERVRDELLKIIGSNFPYEGIILLRNSTLLDHIMPELIEGIDVSQVRPGRHHTTDVFTHNLLSLKFCPSDDPIVRFATLLHDVGKPKVATTDKNGFVIFHNHEIAGAQITREICDRLKFSKKDREKIVNLIRWHMFTVDEKITDAAVRRFIRRVGVENVKDMMDLRIGDRLGGGTQTAESWRLKLFKKRVEEQLAPLPFSVNDLAIDGNDIMKILNIKPGPRVGELLQKLFEEVDEDLSKNKKEYLTKRIQELK
ncbi:MAG: HD domain-containing protein [Candidatus Levybacteria bacterium]|nr:HD domain-containing protein [Candidatus Levybacteria bacterium]